ncbi:hypothetical protein NHQ30_003454 [Ciborinia camelliae]|nr:hypothetical protein NHQ30_003454 [Ciborinia camelliae]
MPSSNTATMCFTYQVEYGCKKEDGTKEEDSTKEEDGTGHSLYVHRLCEMQNCYSKVEKIEFKKLFCEECLGGKREVLQGCTPYRELEDLQRDLINDLKTASDEDIILNNEYLKRQVSFLDKCSIEKDLDKAKSAEIRSPFQVQELMHRRLDRKHWWRIQFLAVTWQNGHLSGIWQEDGVRRATKLLRNKKDYDLLTIAKMLHKAAVASVIAHTESDPIMMSCCKEGTQEHKMIEPSPGRKLIINFGDSTKPTNTFTDEEYCASCKGEVGDQACEVCRCWERRVVQYKGNNGNLVFVDSTLLPRELKPLIEIANNFLAREQVR